MNENHYFAASNFVLQMAMGDAIPESENSIKNQ